MAAFVVRGELISVLSWREKKWQASCCIDWGYGQNGRCVLYSWTTGFLKIGFQADNGLCERAEDGSCPINSGAAEHRQR